MSAGPALHGARRGYLLVLAATVSWATSGTFVKIIRTDYGLSAWTLAFWRDLITFITFLSISLATGPARLRVTRRDLPPLAAMGALSIGIFHVLWNLSVTMNSVATATVLNYTSPFFVVLLAWLFWRERPDRRQALALFLAFAGCVLVTGAYSAANLSVNGPGLLVGLSSGLTYGTYTVFGKSTLRRCEPLAVLTYAFGFAALTLLILQPGAIPLMFDKPPAAWLWIVVLVLVSTVAGFTVYTIALRSLAASSASITATLEPVIAAAFAFLLLGEVVRPVQALGGLLVIGAVILLSQRQSG